MNSNPELTGLVDEFFRETFGPDVITAVERDGPSAALWRATGKLGLPLIGIPERSGGSGGTLGDLLTVLQGPAGGRCRCRWPRPAWPPGCWPPAECRYPPPRWP